MAALALPSSSSITAVNFSRGCAPLRKVPLMNDAGVPWTPTVLPTAMSSSIFLANSPLSNEAFHLALSTPDCTAHCSYFSGESAVWFWKARPWNFQKALEPPWRKTVSAASDAGRALGWNGSGLLFHTTRSLSGPYFSFSCVMVVSTLLQKGHWKSLKRTSVTGAVRLPHTGSLEETGTAASSSLHEPPSATAAISSPPWCAEPLRSTPHINPIPAMKQRRKPTMAVPLFIICTCSSLVRAERGCLSG